MNQEKAIFRDSYFGAFPKRNLVLRIENVVDHAADLSSLTNIKVTDQTFLRIRLTSRKNGKSRNGGKGTTRIH